MIDLRGSRFTDIMPENLASQLETQAFAYALGRQIEKLCHYADRVRIYAAVDTMPEKILDVLAIELRTPAYSEDFSIDIKRTLIKGTIAFYAKLGTPAAVNWVIRSVFGNGNMEDWYSYSGEPHHFRAVIGVAGEITPESLNEFRRLLVSIKRLSSWLDSIITVTEMPGSLYISPAMGPAMSITTLQTVPLPPMKPAQVYTSAAAVGGIAIRELPSAEPVFRGSRTVSIAPMLGGSFSNTRLPTLLRPARLGAAAVLGGSYSVTSLPDKRTIKM